MGVGLKKVRMLQGRVHRRKEVALPPFGGSILHARPAEAGAKPAQRAKGGLELGGGRASREPWRCFFPLPSTDQHHHPGPCKRKCQMPNPYPYPWGKIDLPTISEPLGRDQSLGLGQLCLCWGNAGLFKEEFVPTHSTFSW